MKRNRALSQLWDLLMKLLILVLGVSLFLVMGWAIASAYAFLLSLGK